MFLVHYLDDRKQKHICVANSLYELDFLKERFYEVSFELIEK